MVLSWYLSTISFLIRLPNDNGVSVVKAGSPSGISSNTCQTGRIFPKNVGKNWADEMKLVRRRRCIPLATVGGNRSYPIKYPFIPAFIDDGSTMWYVVNNVSQFSSWNLLVGHGHIWERFYSNFIIMDWKTPQLRQCIIFKPKSKPIYFTHRLTTQTKRLSRGEWGKLGQVLFSSLGYSQTNEQIEFCLWFYHFCVLHYSILSKRSSC